MSESGRPSDGRRAKGGTSIANVSQAEAWNAYEGRHWADHHDRWDAANGGFNEPLLQAAAIRANERVLDVGCGNGQTTRLAARLASRGHAVGLDLSAPMLVRARASAVTEGIRNVSFDQGDAQVYPFPSGNFDVAISRFGIMFFADPVAAFANIGDALRPEGRLAFVCNQDATKFELFRVLMPVVAQHLPMPVLDEPGGAGMFSLADPQQISNVLSRAGFEAIVSTAIERPMHFGRTVEEAAAFMLETGPVHALLAAADPATSRAVLDALIGALRPYQDAGGVQLQGAAWLVTATRPRRA